MALKEVLARFGIDIDGADKLKAADGLVGKMTKGLATLGAGITALGVLRGVRDAINDQINLGDELDKTAQVSNVSAKALQQWRHAADLSGVGAEQMNDSLRTFTKAVFDAGKGSQMQVDAFKEIGVALKDSKGELRTTEPLLRDVMFALRGLSSQEEKAGQAARLFGESGAKLLPLFNMTEEGLRGALAEVEKYGGGVSNLSIVSSAAAKDALARFNLALMSVRSALIVAVLPAITWTMGKFAEFAGWATKVYRSSSALSAGLATLGFMFRGIIAAGIRTALAAAIKFFPTLMGYAVRLLPAFLKFAAVFLLFDDLITFVRGGNSVIGKMIDKVFGLGASAKFVWRLHDILGKIRDGKWSEGVDSLKDGLAAMGQKIADTIPWIKKMTETEGPVTVDDITSVESWNQAIENSKSPLQKFGDAVVAAGATVSSWASSVGSAASSAWTYLANLAVKIFKWASGLVAPMIKAGGEMIDGLVSALKAGAARVKAAILAPVKGALKAAGAFGKSIGNLLTGGTPSGASGGSVGGKAGGSVAAPSGKLGFGGGTTNNFYGTRVQQSNANTITVPGARNPTQTAQYINRSLGRNDSSGLESAFNAMVDLG